MILNYKYRLEPNKKEHAILCSWVNGCRALYNLALEHRIHAWTSCRKSILCNEQLKELTLLRKEFGWIKDIPVTSSQEIIQRLDTSFKKFFNENQGYPKFQKKDKFKSIVFKTNVRVIGKKVKLPKLGFLKFNLHRPLPDNFKLKRTILLKEQDYFYVSFLIEVPTPPVNNSNNHAVGIDFGITTFLTLSDNSFYSTQSFSEEVLKIKRLARDFSKKRKGSNNRKKSLKKLRKAYKKLTNKRTDHLHKLTSILVKKYDVIVLEKLNIQKMLKKNSYIANSLQHQCFHQFTNLLKYKLEKAGKRLIFVDPKYTSQQCNVCKKIDRKSRKTQSVFKCTSCGHKENADLNASKNILVKGSDQLVKPKEA